MPRKSRAGSLLASATRASPAPNPISTVRGARRPNKLSRSRGSPAKSNRYRSPSSASARRCAPVILPARTTKLRTVRRRTVSSARAFSACASPSPAGPLPGISPNCRQTDVPSIGEGATRVTLAGHAPGEEFLTSRFDRLAHRRCNQDRILEVPVLAGTDEQAGAILDAGDRQGSIHRNIGIASILDAGEGTHGRYPSCFPGGAYPPPMARMPKSVVDRTGEQNRISIGSVVGSAGVVQW